MIIHSMKMVEAAVDHVNPGQVPIITMDQPLFALGKQLQWTMSDIYGEDRYIVMMGGLHIEMASLKMIGQWLTNSGWGCALVQADITTPGRANAILKASHVTRSRYTHQITACALHVLQQKAYDADSSITNQQIDFKDWVEEKSQKYPQFKFWSIVLKLELTVLQLVKSLREGNFTLYIQIFGQLSPWMFALDHINYARRHPIHIRDMLSLKDIHPTVHKEF